MRLLFLRGQVPTDRNPKQIMYDNLAECCDMWTQLAAELAIKGHGEVWYWGGKRKVKYRPNFVERWIPNFRSAKCPFQPNVIFTRGGFAEYDMVLRRYPKAFKIYYGAGRRYVPRSKFQKYNLIINDSPDQLRQTRKKFPKIKSSLFVKPAADNIFKPHEAEKRFDVIFVGNEHRSGYKGHGFILKTTPPDVKMIQVGIASKRLKRTFRNVKFTGWVPRKRLPLLYAQSKIAVISCEGVDSCPRVIPEALACGCPVLITQKTRFWHERYINEKTGVLCPREKYVKTLRSMLERYETFDPYSYYRDHLSLEHAATYLKSLMEKAK